MRPWKLLGLAGLAGVAATGAVLARNERQRRAYTPDDVRERLHARLAEAAERPERFVGLHVFNPVPRMKLVELVFPAAAAPDTRARAHALCEDLGKTPVEVPDTPGFVVNRLLFPYLFSAVRLMEETGMPASDVDTCMTLGAGHPMGPLALLDLVGLDVSAAIGDEIGAEVPETVRRLVAEGALGRKSGRGLTL